MSATYRAVTWNPHKKNYDLVLLAGVVLYLAAFMGIGLSLFAGDHALRPEVLLIRALGSAAIILLHLILCIGPLARLSTLWLPLLYNRRHLGVTMFVLALAHGVLSLVYYHGFGYVNPLVSLFTIYPEHLSLQTFPFQILGFFGLMILFLMAATSHDFWLNQFSPQVWKALHMLVYPAYALLVAHVMLGSWQSDRSPILMLPLLVGLVLVTGLHLIAGIRAWSYTAAESKEDWLKAGRIEDVPAERALRVTTPTGEHLAVYRDGDELHAFDGTCAHQGGPLSEGKLIDGCVTCPWHGWQYQVNNGASPPPYLEKVAKHAIRVEAGEIYVACKATEPGTPLAGAKISGGDS